MYVFRVMTCDAYYDKHPSPPPEFKGDRCSKHEIQASTARAFALVGASTTLFGLVNLFLTGWFIKRIGVKATLTIQVFWPAVRLVAQNLGVYVGKDLGILIIQLSQIITIIGGPLGYMLALNTFIAEVVENKERTGGLGKLQGCMFIGTAIGFLAGGLVAEKFGIQAPFIVTLGMFTLCSIYVFLSLPSLPRIVQEETTQRKGLSRFFGPLRIFVPQKWVLPDGGMRKQYGALLLALGDFLAILATSFIPIMLQMFATDAFGFGTARNSYLVSMNSLLRGIFLMTLFPKIIKVGRQWTSRRKSRDDTQDTSEASTLLDATVDEIPTSPDQIESRGAMENEEEPAQPIKLDDKEETYAFDLLYTQSSIFIDAVITGSATFITHGWQLYLVAALLPFAAGTGASAKGVILQMCTKQQRVDALSAITLVENMARLSSTGVFGPIFAAFADKGQQQLVFACNAVSKTLALMRFC